MVCSSNKSELKAGEEEAVGAYAYFLPVDFCAEFVEFLVGEDEHEW